MTVLMPDIFILFCWIINFPKPEQSNTPHTQHLTAFSYLTSFYLLLPSTTNVRVLLHHNFYQSKNKNYFTLLWLNSKFYYFIKGLNFFNENELWDQKSCLSFCSTAPCRSLRHCQRGNLTNPILITSFLFLFQPRDHQEP